MRLIKPYRMLAALLLLTSCAKTPAGDPDFLVALSGHLNCALRGDNGGEQDTQLDAPFTPVAASLKTDPRTGLKLVASHSCRHQGHRVEHFVFRTANGLVSMFIDPASSGSAAKSGKDQDFRLERFPVGQYAAFLVSKLAPETSQLLAEQLRVQTSAAMAEKPAN
jgi:hypothetical protein